MIKLAVFDMAGTTISDDGAVQQHLFQALVSAGANPVMDDVNALMGYPKPLAISMLLSQYLDQDIAIDHELTQKAHATFLNTLDHHYATTENLKPTPNAEDIFEMMHQNGIKVALDTGFGRSTAEIIVQRLGWLDRKCIDFLITSDDVEQGRPEPDMIYAAMEAFNVKDTSQVIKIGDTKSDMLQGTVANCAFVVGVTTGAYTEADLKEFPHTHLIDNLMSLKDILQLK